MKKVILMSIQPKWLVKILNGEKTIEIRKTMPKCELPIDVYIYCTKTNKKGWCMVGINGNETYYQKYDRNAVYSSGHNYIGNGKVVAKFTLNKCYELEYEDTYGESYFWKNTVISGRELCKKSCLDDCELDDYSNGKTLYAWHIDDLVIFNEPMELREFSASPYTDWVEYRVRKAPKSWQYIYIKEDK